MSRLISDEDDDRLEIASTGVASSAPLTSSKRFKALILTLSLLLGVGVALALLVVFSSGIIGVALIRASRPPPGCEYIDLNHVGVFELVMQPEHKRLEIRRIAGLNNVNNNNNNNANSSLTASSSSTPSSDLLCSIRPRQRFLKSSVRKHYIVSPDGKLSVTAILNPDAVNNNSSSTSSGSDYWYLVDCHTEDERPFSVLRTTAGSRGQAAAEDSSIFHILDANFTTTSTNNDARDNNHNNNIMLDTTPSVLGVVKAKQTAKNLRHRGYYYYNGGGRSGTLSGGDGDGDGDDDNKEQHYFVSDFYNQLHYASFNRSLVNEPNKWTLRVMQASVNAGIDTRAYLMAIYTLISMQQQADNEFDMVPV